MKVLAEVSLVTAAAMRRLNRRFRKIDQPTDVLAFPLDDFAPGPDGIARLGDIVICQSEAKKKGHSLPFLIRHAMLHLLGKHHR